MATVKELKKQLEKLIDEGKGDREVYQCISGSIDEFTLEYLEEAERNLNGVLNGTIKKGGLYFDV